MGESAASERLTESGFAPVTPSVFDRISNDLSDWRGRPNQCPEQRTLWQRLSGTLALPIRTDIESAKCKLACLVSWMQGQKIEVPARVLMVLSDHCELQRQAARELLARRRAQDRKRADDCADAANADPAEALVPDTLTALRLAIAECEERTAPVTARTASAVDDSGYIGYQRRRTISARLFLAALASFWMGCSLNFIHAACLQPGAEVWWKLDGILTVHFPDSKLAVSYLLLPTERLCWGLVGASFYLLRRLYDFTEQRTFDHRLVGMYKVRLIMGGIAGGIVSLLIDSDAGSLEAPARAIFGSHAIAIIGGFSVRAVYALIERLTEMIRDQFARPAAKVAEAATRQGVA